MSYKSTIKEFTSKVKVHEAAFRDSPLLRIKCIDGELKFKLFYQEESVIDDYDESKIKMMMWRLKIL